MLAHPSLPQIDQGLIPVVVQAWEYFIARLVLSRLDSCAQLFESEFRLGFTVRMIEDIHELPHDVAEAFHKTLIGFFQFVNGLPFLS